MGPPWPREGRRPLGYRAHAVLVLVLGWFTDGTGIAHSPPNRRPLAA